MIVKDKMSFEKLNIVATAEGWLEDDFFQEMEEKKDSDIEEYP